MKLYQLIEAKNLDKIKINLSFGHDIQGISFLSIMDKIVLDHEVLKELKQRKAITQYEQLFETQDHTDSIANVYQGIKRLISSWRNNNLCNDSLKNDLNKEARENIKSYWIKNQSNSTELVNKLNVETSRFISTKFTLWFKSNLEETESEEFDEVVVSWLKSKLSTTAKTRFFQLLSITFETHKDAETIQYFRKNQIIGEFKKLLELKLFSQLSFDSATFEEKLSDWRNHLLPISEEIKFSNAVFEVMSTSTLPEKLSDRITMLTIKSLIEKTKNKTLDPILCGFLHSEFRVIIENHLLEKIFSQTTNALNEIIHSVLSAWQSGQTVINSPFPLEKLCLPKLYKAKRACKRKLTQAENSLKSIRENVEENQDELTRMRATLTHIPDIVRGLVNYHLEQSESLTNTERHRASTSFGNNDQTKASNLCATDLK